ncbi:MAG: cytochrome c [Paludibacter sp.]|nr:cytochrome c [Paludibacter sp.]
MTNKFLVGALSLIGFLLISMNAVAVQPKEMITKVEMGPINPQMVNAGKGLFTSKCAMCHDLDQKKVGPTLRNVTKERKPDYIMNVIYNTTKMQKNDPTFKALVVKFKNVPMPDPNLSEAQARSLLEYLRSVAK